MVHPLQAQRLLDEARREKESMVMKYALAEQKNIEAADRVSKMEAHVREVNKEREQMLSHCRVMKAEKTKATEAYEAKVPGLWLFSCVGRHCIMCGVLSVG